MFPLRPCGGKPLVAVTQERCYGPSRLRINDDDAFVFYTSHAQNVACVVELFCCIVRVLFPTLDVACISIVWS